MTGKENRMVNFIGTPVLRMERLTLRPFRPDDAADAFYNWFSDPAAARYMFWEPAQSVEQVREKISSWLKPDLDFCQWAIVPEQENTVAGAINLHAIDDFHESAEIAYVLGRRFWSKGYMTEALRAVIRFGFETMLLNRIYGDHFVTNPASGRVMQKAGMRFEGVMRQKYRGKQGFEDTACYAVLRGDLPEQE